jgi:uridine kinase
VNAENTDRLCIGVAGGTGSGKTTVAEEIVRRVGRERIAVVNHDRYDRDLSAVDERVRLQHNFDHPNALDLVISRVEQLAGGREAGP